MSTSICSILCPLSQSPARVLQYAGQILERSSDLTEYFLHIVKNTNQPIACTLHDAYLLLVVEKDVSAQVHIQATGSVNLEVFLLDGAQLTCSFSAENCTLQQRSRIGNSAQIAWNNRTTGDCKQSLVSQVSGRDARSDIQWVFHATGKQTQSVSAQNIYQAKNGRGKITLRGVAQDQAQVICNGMIEIREGGSGTDTFLTEDVLMLDPTAKVDAVPALEIKANDVKASHSASVRRVTPLDLFSFAARGIEGKMARTMYVEGFLGLHGG